MHMIYSPIQETGGAYVPNSASLTFTKTGYNREGCVPEISNYDVSTGLIRATKDPDDSTAQRVMATGKFGPHSKPRHNFVFVLEETDREKSIWVGRALQFVE